MIKDAGDGRERGLGAYGKEPGAHAGAVYVVSGSSGMTSGGALNHPAMFTSLNELGSLVVDVVNDRLDAQFLNANGNVTDEFTISKAPLVTLTATEPVTTEQGATPGIVTIRRSRNLENALPVTLTMGGVAKPGLDFSRITNPFTIPAGEASVTLHVAPLPDELFEGTETVVVSAAVGASYRVHRDSRTATVLIKDRQMEIWRSAKFGADAGDPEIAGDEADPDGDFRTNGAEFIAGTEPRDRSSFLKSDFSRDDTGVVTLRFLARAQRGYSVVYKNGLGDAQWKKLANVAPESVDREVIVVDGDAAAQPQRFYRVVAPQQE
jgi:hypothetical protein